MSATRTAKQTILVVDDMRTNLTALAHALQAEWAVKIATDGANALRIAASEPQPDLILLDVKMPGMDGYEVCRRLKQERRTRDIPIIFITALNEEKDEAQGLALGAIDYISKPFSPPLVRARIRNHLKIQSLTSEYERVFHGTQDAMFLVELTGTGEFRYLRNNQPHQEKTGIALEQLQGATPEDLLGKKLGGEIRRRYAQCAEEGKTLSYEETLNLPAGERVWLTRLTPVVEPGKTTYIVGASTDITDRKLAEKEVAAASRKERELQARIQQMLLGTRPPQGLSGVEIETISRPSRHLDGDFIDFHTFGRHCFDMILGDVMGKGIQAALIGAGAKNLFLEKLAALLYRRAQKKEAQPPTPVQLGSLVDAELGQRLIALEKFITLCYIRVDLASRTLCFVDCGHTEILLRRASSGRCESLKGSNMPLGFVPEQQFRLHSTRLQPGDLIVCYSDGVSEAASPEGEMFGRHRLRSLIERLHDDAEVESIPRQLLEAVSGHTRQNSFADDFTCTVIRIDPEIIYRTSSTMAGQLEQLPKLRRFCRRLIAACPLRQCREEDRSLFTVAVQEAFVNIVEHAFQGRSNSIRLEGLVTKDWVRVRLEYHGKAFDFDTVPSVDRGADPKTMTASRGRGMHIMRSVMDGCVSKQTDIDQACVTLTKNLNQTSSGIE